MPVEEYKKNITQKCQTFSLSLWHYFLHKIRAFPKILSHSNTPVYPVITVILSSIKHPSKTTVLDNDFCLVRRKQLNVSWLLNLPGRSLVLQVSINGMCIYRYVCAACVRTHTHKHFTYWRRKHPALKVQDQSFKDVFRQFLVCILKECYFKKLSCPGFSLN